MRCNCESVIISWWSGINSVFNCLDVGIASILVWQFVWLVMSTSTLDILFILSLMTFLFVLELLTTSSVDCRVLAVPSPLQRRGN
jgi:hypothetical protein